MRGNLFSCEHRSNSGYCALMLLLFEYVDAASLLPDSRYFSLLNKGPFSLLFLSTIWHSTYFAFTIFGLMAQLSNVTGLTSA